jgi:hypothetical protein
MKILIKSLLLISVFYGCNTTGNPDKKSIDSIKRADSHSNMELNDSMFQYHFKVLDSVSKASPKYTFYYCCNPSIKFMEVNTSIEAHSKGTQLGKLGFTKEDLQKWHEWYEKKYKKEK